MGGGHNNQLRGDRYGCECWKKERMCDLAGGEKTGHGSWGHEEWDRWRGEIDTTLYNI